MLTRFFLLSPEYNSTMTHLRNSILEKETDVCITAYTYKLLVATAE